ncbi:proline-rich protein 2-like [Meles meles]|uniref:proline-rich protein 2-like n=1 Tax=Meles meles TaxID=9662 RepID=UPI001E69D20D|nr:proline-rich protein 2-like [Meles meles]
MGPQRPLLLRHLQGLALPDISHALHPGQHRGETPPSRLQGLGAAPHPTLPRGSEHAPGTRRPLPAPLPTKVGGRTPAPPSQGGSGPAPPAVTCCRGRLPPHTTPDSGDGGGWSRGSHMKPPGSPALRSRRRGPPRSARIRDSGPEASANPAPPLRLWLPQEKPPFSVPRCPRPPSGTPCRRETPSASRGHRVGPHRLGPDSDSKMASGARGRALSPARLRPRGRARVRWGAPAEGGGRRQWAAPAGSAHPRYCWGPPPPGSGRVCCLPPPVATATFRGFFVLKPVWEGWS